MAWRPIARRRTIIADMLRMSMLVSEVRRYGPMRVEQHGKEHRALALWAARCAERVLPLFEKKHPGDDRPRRALAVARAYARGEIDFSMRMVREASLSAHAAARAADDPVARAAARASGQAVAMLHIPRHACGAAAYAIAAVVELAPTSGARAAISRERSWQSSILSRGLRSVVFSKSTKSAKGGSRAARRPRRSKVTR